MLAQCLGCTALAPALSQWPSPSMFWLVDPLDGTRGFIEGCDEYTVNIALIQNHKPVLGVIVAPALGLSYTAASQSPATVYRCGQAQQITVSNASKAKRAVLSRYHNLQRLEAFDGHGIDLPASGQVNSSLKFCLVAAGQYDFYPRLGPTSLWDTAAGQIILEQAGGAVLDLQGRRLQYHLESGLLNPNFIAVGDHSIVTDILDFCAKIRRTQ